MNFFSCVEKANTELRNTSNYFADGILIEMATKFFLDDKFDRNLER